jgi:hypothetical protein
MSSVDRGVIYVICGRTTYLRQPTRSGESRGSLRCAVCSRYCDGPVAGASTTSRVSQYDARAARPDERLSARVRILPGGTQNIPSLNGSRMPSWLTIEERVALPTS